MSYGDGCRVNDRQVSTVVHEYTPNRQNQTAANDAARMTRTTIWGTESWHDGAFDVMLLLPEVAFASASISAVGNGAKDSSAILLWLVCAQLASLYKSPDSRQQQPGCS